MDPLDNPQNRKSSRSNVMMNASIELSGVSIPVRLRNLSVDGALVESDRLPVEGASVHFRRGDLNVQGKIAWVDKRTAGISFDQKLDPQLVLRNVPRPRPHTPPKFHRPGIKSQKLSAADRHFGETFLWGGPIFPEKD